MKQFLRNVIVTDDDARVNAAHVDALRRRWIIKRRIDELDNERAGFECNHPCPCGRTISGSRFRCFNCYEKFVLEQERLTKDTVSSRP